MAQPGAPPGGGRRLADQVLALGARLAGAARLERVVLVTGTNGKTTAMLAAALAAGGRRVASNAAGSNLYRGLATALLAAGRAVVVANGRAAGTAPADLDQARLRAVLPRHGRLG